MATKPKLKHDFDYGSPTITDNFIAKIEPDDEPQNPRMDDNFGTMVCWHDRYNLGDKNGLDNLISHIHRSPKYDDRWDVHEKATPGQLRQWAEKCNFFFMPLYLMDHSGISMSCASFSCPWDSGQVGWIFVTPEQIADDLPHLNEEDARLKAMNILRAEVETYSTYIEGDVWGYVIEDREGNEVESCWGFFGWDAVASEADAALCYLEDNPPDTILTPREEQMFKRIVELGCMVSHADANMNDLSPTTVAGIEAISLGIIHTWED